MTEVRGKSEGKSEGRRGGPDGPGANDHDWIREQGNLQFKKENLLIFHKEHSCIAQGWNGVEKGKVIRASFTFSY